MAEAIGQKVGEKPFDVSKQFFACTLEMVCGKFLDILTCKIGLFLTKSLI